MCASIFSKLFKNASKPTPEHSEVGRAGEAAAADYLRRSGYQVLERNWRCPIGELDLVCRRGETYVFVEVKASRHRTELPPEVRINARKQRKLLSVAAAYRKSHSLNAPCRIDAVTVWWQDGKPVIRHIENVCRP